MKPRFDPNFLQVLKTLAENPALRKEVPDPPEPKAAEVKEQPQPAQSADGGVPEYYKGQFTPEGKRVLNAEEVERRSKQLAYKFMEAVELDPRLRGDNPGDCIEKLSAAVFAAITTIQAAFATVAGITEVIHKKAYDEARGEGDGGMTFSEVMEVVSESQERRQAIAEELCRVFIRYEAELAEEILRKYPT